MNPGYTQCSKCSYRHDPTRRRNDTKPAHFPCRCEPKTCVACTFAEALVRLDEFAQANDTKTKICKSLATCEVCGLEAAFEEIKI